MFYLDYAPVYHRNYFYIFGGRNAHYGFATTKIARLDTHTKTWSIVGELNNPRLGHSVIFNGQVFFVVGGKSHLTQETEPMKTEQCTLASGKMSCIELESTLNNYVYYPVLLTVDNKFIKNCN